MPSVKMTSSMGNSKKGAPKSAESRKTGAQTIYTGKRIVSVPKWTVSDYKPPRKISDKELEAARKMFFELDRDGSGSIDAEELGMMLRSLGQNPTEEELVELINSVDDGDKDGQIQLREFLKLYTEGLDTKANGMAGKDDLANVFRSLGVRAHATHPLPQTRMARFHCSLRASAQIRAHGMPYETPTPTARGLN